MSTKPVSYVNEITKFRGIDLFISRMKNFCDELMSRKEVSDKSSGKTKNYFDAISRAATPTNCSFDLRTSDFERYL